MLTRWTKIEDSYLIDNQNKRLKELSVELNRTVASIKGRKKILKLTINDKWGEDELKKLKSFYSNSSKETLLKLFPTRTWSGILGMAKKLKIDRLEYYHNELKNHNLKVLLEDKKQTYYFIGLLMADGYFNGRGIILSQTIKNSKIIDNFGEYINCNNIKQYNGSGDVIIQGKKTYGNNLKIINATDLNLVPKIMEKFDIIYEKNIKTKTYYPPTVLLFDKMSDKLFLSYLIGFIDGDGSITKEIRNGNSIIITSHKNWLPVLKNWSNRLEEIFKCKLSEKSLKKEKDCYMLRIYNQSIIKPLKEFIIKNKLMVNENKWGRINE